MDKSAPAQRARRSRTRTVRPNANQQRQPAGNASQQRQTAGSSQSRAARPKQQLPRLPRTTISNIPAVPNLSTGSGPIRRQANVMDTLAKSMGSTKLQDPRTDFRYITCRLDPFCSQGGLGITDGSNVKKFVVDYRYFTDISLPLNGVAVNLLFTPTLPTSTWIRCPTKGAYSFVDAVGNTIANTNMDYNSSTNITSGIGWTPMGYPAELVSIAQLLPNANSYNCLANPANPYGASKARIITMAHKIYYTGQASQASGTITTQDVSATFNEGELTLSTAVVNPLVPSLSVALTNTLPTPNIAGYFAGTVNTLPYTMTVASSTLTNSTVCTRVEAGALIMPKHSGSVEPNKYRWTDLHNQPMIPVVFSVNLFPFGCTTGAVTTTSGPPYTSTMTNVWNNGGFWTLDTDWQFVNAVITGYQPGSTFRVETVFCVEYQTVQGSPFERVTFSAPKDTGAMIAAQTVADKIPTASPVAVEPYGWVLEAVEIAKRIGMTAGKILSII
jgi:hypothetical protein